MFAYFSVCFLSGAKREVMIEFILRIRVTLELNYSLSFQFQLINKQSMTTLISYSNPENKLILLTFVL